MTARLPSVVTPQERGALGYLAQQASLERQYGKAGAARRRAEWRKGAGRKSNATYFAIADAKFDATTGRKAKPKAGGQPSAGRHTPGGGR